MDISNIIDNVKNIILWKKDTKGYADNCILLLNDPIKFQDTPVDDIFMKYYISTEKHVNIEEESILSIHGCRYETRVYKYFISYLVSNGICDNFLTYYGSMKNIRVEFLAKILSDTQEYKQIYGNVDYRSDPSERIVSQLVDILREVDIEKDLLNRKVHENKTISKYINESLSESEYYKDIYIDICLLECIEKDNCFLLYEIDKKIDDDVEILCIYIQILYVLLVFEKFNFVHNDLHTGNIWIKKVKQRNINYEIYGKKYSIKSSYKVILFDFDRSYWEPLKNNNNLDFYCDRYQQCNENIEKRDLFTFICGNIRNMRNIAKLFIIDSDDEEIIKLFKKNCYFKDKNSMLTFLDKIYDIKICIDNLSKIKKDGKKIFFNNFQYGEYYNLDNSEIPKNLGDYYINKGNYLKKFYVEKDVYIGKHLFFYNKISSSIKINIINNVISNLMLKNESLNKSNNESLNESNNESMNESNNESLDEYSVDYSLVLDVQEYPKNLYMVTSNKLRTISVFDKKENALDYKEELKKETNKEYKVLKIKLDYDYPVNMEKKEII